MSSIPPNIVGSVFQAQISAAETAKKDDAQRNKRIRDSKQLERASEIHQQEVEDTNHAEGLRVAREENKEHSGRDAHDVYEQHQSLEEDKKLYSTHPKPSLPDQENKDDSLGQDHIDLSG